MEYIDVAFAILVFGLSLFVLFDLKDVLNRRSDNKVKAAEFEYKAARENRLAAEARQHQSN